MKLIALLLLLLTFSSTKQACAAGCLKCDGTSNCIVPDLSQNYVLNNNTAVASTLQYCLILNADGSCASCNVNYYLDPATSRCVAVPPASYITGCSYYNTLTSCRLCNETTYLNNNVCTPVSPVITNCAAYANATTCSACNSGYALALDSKSCVSTSGVNNCSGYTYVTCASCTNGYYLNRNNYLAQNLVNTTPANRTDLALFARNVIRSTNFVGLDVCVSTTGTNCTGFTADSTACTACSAGYYLDATAGDCKAYPVEQIPNCDIYSSSTTCTSCQPNFLLTNNTCVALDAEDRIDNCETHSTRASSPTCVKCLSTHFLTNNTCSLRVNTANIQNCATINLNGDTCTQCATNFAPVSTNDQCLPAIPFCAVHSTPARDGTLQCISCQSTYYLVAAGSNPQNSCAKGSVDNCSIYSGSAGTTCTTCIAEYYLSGNACVKHTTIADCSEYSETNANECSTCNANRAFLVTQQNRCQSIAGFARCIAYSGTAAAPVCTACDDGYYLSANNVCSAIADTNCLVGASANSVFTCSRCKLGYVLSYNNRLCVAPLSFIAEQCNESNAIARNNATFSTYECDNCKLGAVPYDFLGQYACLSYAETAQLNGGVPLAATGTINVRNNKSVNTVNCLKFTSDLACAQCDPASNTPYLQILNGATSCIAACPNDVYEKYQIDLTSFQISAFNVCSSLTSFPDCEVYAPDLNDTTNFVPICIQCKATAIAVLPSDTAYSNVNPSATVTQPNNSVTFDYIPSPNARYPGVSCVLRNTILNSGYDTQLLPDPIDNCDHYAVTQTADVYACRKCKLGYTGVPNVEGFLDSCNNTESCALTDVYNLPAAFANIFSCKTCPNANNVANVPVLVYKGTSATVATFDAFVRHSYQLTSVNGGPISLVDPSGNENNITCQARDAAPTGVTTWSTTTYSGTNYAGCGLIAVNSEAGGDNTNGSIGNFCVACSPGYKPTAGSAAYIQSNCTLIDHCSTTDANMFNACHRCDTNYIFAFANSNVDYTTCLLVTDTTKLAHCYAAAADANTATSAGVVCSVCATGYNLNKDFICEAVTPTNCVAQGFNSYKINDNGSLDWALFVERNGAGCNRCSNSRVPVLISASTNVCLTNTYITAPATRLVDENYIPNCQNYNATNTAALKCSFCADGFVLNYANGANDKTICYEAVTQLAFCSLAATASTCHECKSTSYALLTDGTCVAGTDNDCATYENSATGNIDAVPVCTGCKSGLYLNNAGVCVDGPIANCNQYADEDTCVTCNPGHVLRTNDAGVADICIPIPAGFNCKEFTILNNGDFTCDTCDNNNTLIAAPIISGIVASACLPFSLIEGCATYDSNTIGATNFYCSACEDNRYLANNKCNVRTEIAKCVTTDPTSDTCTACDDSSYLTNNGQTCTNKPSGIYRCEVYTNATTCSACRAGFFLANNACSPVTGSVTGCRVFSSATTCSVCNNGLYLSSNACIAPSATNCLTVASPTACATCSPGSYLTDGTAIVGGNTVQTKNCAAPATINGCATRDATNGTVCTACTPNFYLNNGTCTAVVAPITQCAAHSSATQCARCNSGFTLNVEKTACLNTANVLAYDDGNCSNSQLVQNPTCSRCSAGRYFVNGACTGTCTVTGCLACSPASNSTCYICNTGYYQDSTGRCNAIQTATEGSASIFGVLSAIVMVFAVMFK